MNAQDTHDARVWESLPCGVITFDAAGTLRTANEAACALLGRSRALLVGGRWPAPELQPLQEDRSPLSDSGSPVVRAIQTAQPLRGVVLGVLRPGSDGHRWLQMDCTPLLTPEGTVQEVLCTFMDITEALSRRNRQADLSHRDPLTGLPDRQLFIDRLHQTIVQARRHGQVVGVLYLDLERFKRFNRTLGFPAGDQLLREVAQRLSRSLREGDTIARLGGGDDFAIVLPNIQMAQNAARVAEKIQRVLERPYQIEGQELFIDIRLGISLFPLDGADTEQLLRDAESAMYTAKQAGKACYNFFTPDLNDTARKRLTLESSLRRALEQGEFLVHYQPQVDMRQRQIIGMEALIRWKHPTMGLVSPASFIPVAEESGLIIDIGRWVLKTACAQNKAWQQAGLSPVPVSVNLSPRQLRDKDFLAGMVQVLQETGLDARYLELELTETSLAQNAEETIAIMREMKTMGVQISIDDFGIGHSSLARLQSFPVDTLKIDQSFLKDIKRVAPDLPNAVIVRTIVELARGLRLKVIAEGVETEEQLAFLRTLQCNEVQGYLFSAPVPAEQFERLLKKSHLP